MAQQTRNGKRPWGAEAGASPWFEALEGRRLMSVALAGGTLKITGTAGDDAYVVSINPDDATQLDVSMCGHTDTFALADITKMIKVKLGDGEDVFEVDDSNGPVNIRFKIEGG